MAAQWIKEAWEIYQLIGDSPINSIDLYGKLNYKSNYDHVTFHNIILKYLEILHGHSLIKTPQPIDWDKPYHGYSFKPRGHWTMYIAKQVTWKQFKKLLVESYW